MNRPRPLLRATGLVLPQCGTQRATGNTLVFALALLLAAACAPPSMPTTPDDDALLRVMAFNIRFGSADDGPNSWPYRQELLIETVAAYDPDVLGMQEAERFQLDTLGARLPGYTEVGVGRDDGARAGEYSPLFVRTARFEVLDRGTFWFSDAPQTPGSTSEAWGNRIPRICSWARLRDRRTGRAFYVYSLHWDHEAQEARLRSAALLLDHIAARAHEDDPVIVTGDFNAGEDNPAFAQLLGRDRVPLVDTYRAVHPPSAGEAVGTFNAFAGRTDGAKIDAVLASPSWTVVDAAIDRTERDGRTPSDHFPVTATLAW